jgi:hypothetical protein
VERPVLKKEITMPKPQPSFTAEFKRGAEIQPDAVADDFRWEAVSFVIGNSLVRFHETILPYYPSSLAKLTIPCHFLAGPLE